VADVTQEYLSCLTCTLEPVRAGLARVSALRITTFCQLKWISYQPHPSDSRCDPVTHVGAEKSGVTPSVTNHVVLVASPEEIAGTPMAFPHTNSLLRLVAQVHRQLETPSPVRTHRGPTSPSPRHSKATQTPPQEGPYASTAPRDLIGADVIISQGLARNGLSQFFQQSIGASTWLVFDVYELVRIAYIGTEVSNPTHLISLEQPVPPVLHLPHPPIHPPLPWKPESDPLYAPRANLDTARDLSSFPAKEVRDELVNAYYDQINPYFPVIDEYEFRSQYADPNKPPPLLLLQAVLLAGAHVCNHAKVVQSRSMVKTALFQRGKTLFDMRHENDRLHLVQSALLFTWHLENADTASSNSYY
jgi:hypothetical protein